MLIKSSFFEKLGCVTELHIQTNFLRKTENFCKHVHFTKSFFFWDKNIWNFLISSNTRGSGFFIFHHIGDVGHTLWYLLVLQRPQGISLTLGFSCLGLQPQYKEPSVWLLVGYGCPPCSVPCIFPSQGRRCILAAIITPWISLSKWLWKTFNVGTNPIETCIISNRGCSQFLWPETNSYLRFSKLWKKFDLPHPSASSENHSWWCSTRLAVLT